MKLFHYLKEIVIKLNKMISTNQTTLKIITYNIHKGKSFIFRNNVLKEINTLLHEKIYDFIFLQEVKDFHVKEYKKNSLFQTEILSNGIYKSFYGKNKIYKEGHHGNAILTNHNVIKVNNFNISVNKLESRGFFVLSVDINGVKINMACTHLNLRKKDRLKQINLIDKIIEENYFDEPFILAGDFNDFDKGVEKQLNSLDFHNMTDLKSFPHIYPLFNLDKIFVKNLFINKVESFIIKPINRFILSDHLPIEMDLTFVV